VAKATPKDVQSWLREETPEHLALMSRLREQLASTMATDVNEKGTPTRDWARALGRYQLSYTTLLQEERERIKLRILMAKTGEGGLTDEEYEQEIEQLAVESLGRLPADALQRELERRAQLALAADPKALDGEGDDE